MSEEIIVRLFKYPDRKNLVMGYDDPISGKRITKSASTPDESAAIGTAAVWQDELRTGRYAASSKITWEAFRERFQQEKLAGMPDSTQKAYQLALDHLGRVLAPDRLSKLTTRAMSAFVAKLRDGGMKATTIARHLRHIKAALRWGERQGWIAKAPLIEMPRIPKGSAMKGRPITGEEFDRLIEAVAKVRKNDSKTWTRFLTALWLSGLRLGEALILDWEDGPFVLDISGKYPAFRIEAEGQKSNKAELCPATPDFYQWILSEIPEAERVGRVLKVLDDKTGKPLLLGQVSRVIRKIGEKAGVVVRREKKMVSEQNEATGKVRVVEREVPKHCTAHDLRRSFCTRWSKRVMPATLQRLARHSHISTTMTYYVASTAEEIGTDLLAAWGESEAKKPVLGNKPGNNTPKTTQATDGADRT